MNMELSWLVACHSREQTRKTLPKCFENFYPKVRCIIDCSEIFMETPSSLEVHAACWSDYKHHCTFKFLIGITPNGLISFIYDCYGGRASDKFIVMNSKFMNRLEPYDQVMADRGFKIRNDLAMFQATLAIPPSTVVNFKCLLVMSAIRQELQMFVFMLNRPLAGSRTTIYYCHANEQCTIVR